MSGRDEEPKGEGAGFPAMSDRTSTPDRANRRRRPPLGLILGLASAGVWLRFLVGEPELERCTRARLRPKSERAA